MTGDLRIIRNNVLRKFFVEGHKYRQIRLINLEKTKRYILEGLDNCIWGGGGEGSFLPLANLNLKYF